MNRASFLRRCATAAAAGVMTPALLRAHARTARGATGSWPAVTPEDESFWSFVRDQFPLGHDRVYLNTGGLGASPYAVIDAVKAKMDELEAVSEPGHDADLWKGIKTSAASLMGCDQDELAFTRNTTEGINIVANGLPFRRGDEIITTTHEHVGNALTWLALAKRTGVVLKTFVPSPASPGENVDRIRALLTRRTRLISIPHAITTTGLILPVKEIGEMARARRVWYFIDGAQTAGMTPFDLHAIGCDAFATSGHKWLLGPKETGLLYVRREMLDTIEAKHIGAHSDGGFDFLKGTFALHAGAQRYEYGTVSAPLRAGLGAAVRFIGRIGIDVVWRRDRAMADRLAEGLKEIPGITVLSPDDTTMRSPMITFQHDRMPHTEMLKHLTRRNLRTRPVTEGGLAALRVSLHIYNSFDDVERVLEGVRTAPKG